MTQTSRTPRQPMAQLHVLWDKLGDVPTGTEDDNLDKIEEPFLHFEVGTHREDIWHWFEDQNPLFICGDVMQGIRAADPA